MSEARVVSEVQSARELAFGHDRRGEAGAQVVGDPLGTECSSGPDQPTGSRDGHDGAGRPRLRTAVTDESQTGGVGEQLPCGPGMGPAQVAHAPQAGQMRGPLTQ